MRSHWRNGCFALKHVGDLNVHRSLRLVIETRGWETQPIKGFQGGHSVSPIKSPERHEAPLL